MDTDNAGQRVPPVSKLNPKQIRYCGPAAPGILSPRQLKNTTTRKPFNQNHFAQLRLLSITKPRKFRKETAFEARPKRGALKAFSCRRSEVPVMGRK